MSYFIKDGGLWEVLRIDTGATSFHSIEILLDVEGIIAGFVKPRNNSRLYRFQAIFSFKADQLSSTEIILQNKFIANGRHFLLYLFKLYQPKYSFRKRLRVG